MTQAPAPEALPAVVLAERLRAGAVALMPTDTLPALAARPAFASRIWELKQRPLEKPLILMGADLPQLTAVIGVPWRREWLAMAAEGWPGPLTLVLPARGALIDQLHPGGRSLGLRIPASAEARELLGHSGVLATTSANPSGVAAARDAESARRFFPGLPLLAPIPWPAASGQASTVLAWQGGEDDGVDGAGWRVLRQGAFVLPDRLP